MEPRRFRFGLFEFDTTALELRREGVLIRLQSQPARLLAGLIEHGNQVVSRDDLRKAIWGDETYVDFERGRNFCISQIRSALKDDSAEPTYVRTIPKSGYQLIAPVQPIFSKDLNRQRLRQRRKTLFLRAEQPWPSRYWL